MQKGGQGGGSQGDVEYGEMEAVEGSIRVCRWGREIRRESATNGQVSGSADGGDRAGRHRPKCDLRL